LADEIHKAKAAGIDRRVLGAHDAGPDLSPTRPPASLSAPALQALSTREISWPAVRSPFAASNLIDRQSVAEYENGEIAIQMSHAKVGVQRRGSRRREDEQDVAI
jgi:hypothetical protein